MTRSTSPFDLIETTIDDLRAAYRAGRLTSRELVHRYLDRIDAIDRGGPALNSMIFVNPHALDEAAARDARQAAGKPIGPLHGIPVVVKDQVDVRGMPTTLGSTLFKDYYPDRDAFVIERLRAAGAVILGKTTLGELGGGDTHGSLFGSTRNPYALDRTVGGSSGGSAAAVAANLTTVAIGQEALASIRRPAAWTATVGMRPSAGLVSRSGVYDGWPKRAGSVGPMARTVRDVAILLGVMAGYDMEDPLTSFGFGHARQDLTPFLDTAALRGARIGVLRESMGLNAEPGTDDFNLVTEVFDRAVGELQSLGAEVVDPLEIPNLNQLLALRAADPVAQEESFRLYVGRSAHAPFASWSDLVASPGFAQVGRRAQRILAATSDSTRFSQYVMAREQLMTSFLKAMADNRLDAVVHRSAEHQPTLIDAAFKPPFVGNKGATHLNTFLVFVPAISVPAGFTRDGLPAGISFLGRPFDDGRVIGLAYAYEQATRHRRAPTGLE